MFWPGMVLNQGKLSIFVFDWESYLGSPFSLLSVWVVDYSHYSPVSFMVVSSFVGDILNKKKMYAHHSALWSTSYDARDTNWTVLPQFLQSKTQSWTLLLTVVTTLRDALLSLPSCPLYCCLCPIMFVSTQC